MHQQYGFVEYRGEEDADYVSRPVCSLAWAPFVVCPEPISQPEQLLFWKAPSLSKVCELLMVVVDCDAPA